VLDLTGGNVREAMQFSRHQNVATLLRYDDARRDRAGDLARRLAEDAEAA
jgi:integrase/recombinase XerC